MLNKVVLVGRLTSDPEVRQTQSGTSVTSFTVACNRPYQKDGERQADFINCVAWRQTAEFVGKYFRKGNAIGLDGSIQTRKYQDKDGNNRTAVEVLVNSVTFLESNNNNQTTFDENGNTPVPATQDFEELSSDVDLPF